ALSLLIASVAAPPASAQDCLEQVKVPEVGRWAEYKALYKEKDPYTVRYSVIGSEQRGGKSMQWVELRVKGAEKDRNVIYQMLLPGSLMEMSQVQEIVLKTGDKPAM